jgi:hypothetical protein
LEAGQRDLEDQAVTREEIEALVARERPGWRVVDVLEINDESGPSFEVAVEGGDDRVTLLVSADERIVGERR